jgi:hypothetical protein
MFRWSSTEELPPLARALERLGAARAEDRKAAVLDVCTLANAHKKVFLSRTTLTLQDVAEKGFGPLVVMLKTERSDTETLRAILDTILICIGGGNDASEKENSALFVKACCRTAFLTLEDPSSILVVLTLLDESINDWFPQPMYPLPQKGSPPRNASDPHSPPR